MEDDQDPFILALREIDEFSRFLKKENGLFYSNLYIQYSNCLLNTFDETMIDLAKHEKEIHVLNLNAYWHAFRKGVTDPKTVRLLTN